MVMAGSRLRARQLGQTVVSSSRRLPRLDKGPSSAITAAQAGSQPIGTRACRAKRVPSRASAETVGCVRGASYGCETKQRQCAEGFVVESALPSCLDELRGGACRHVADGARRRTRQRASPVDGHRLRRRHPSVDACLALLHPGPLRLH